MKKKLVALLLAVTVLVGAIVGGTLAYLSDTDSAVNVATVGNVKIKQHELQRTDDYVSKNGHTGTLTDGDLEKYEQNQKLYPAYSNPADTTAYTAEPTELLYWGPYVTAEGAGNGLWNDDKLTGVMDKFVFVENTGRSDAYYRTLFAFECPEGADYSDGADEEFMINVNGHKLFTWEEVGYIKVEVEENDKMVETRFFVMAATYNGVLAAKEISRPSLLQIVMTENANNDLTDALGANYDVLVLSQATQVENMPTEDGAALDAAFGDVTAEKAAEWFKGVVDEAKPWDGAVDTSWYNEEQTVFTLTNESQLAGMAALVDDGTTFEGKTVKLDADMDLGANDAAGDLISFEPMGSYEYDTAFKGTFDGQGHTVSNMYQNGWALENGIWDGDDLGLGLFGLVEDATIKNVNFDGANQPSECNLIGTVAGAAYGNCTFENINVTNGYMGNHSYYSGGLVGWASGNHIYKNITLDESVVVSSQWGDFNNANGGIIGGAGKSGTYHFEDCYVACTIDVFNDVTSAYEWYAYRNAGMLIGNTSHTQVIDGTTYAAAPNVTCKNVTVVYSEWADYHYCQFNAMSYPWVRVEAGSSTHAYGNARYDYATDANGNNVVDENHVHNEGEGHDVLITFNQLFGGAQGGVYGDPDHEGVTIITPYTIDVDVPEDAVEVSTAEGFAEALSTGGNYEITESFTVEGISSVANDLYIYNTDARNVITFAQNARLKTAENADLGLYGVHIDGGGSYTADSNGFTYDDTKTINSDAMLMAFAGSTLTLGKGTVIENVVSRYPAVAWAKGTVDNRATIILEGATIQNCAGGSGSIINVDRYGDVYIEEGTVIADNVSHSGNHGIIRIYNDNWDAANASTLNINGGEIRDNYFSGNGMIGLYYAKMYMNGGKISGNSWLKMNSGFYCMVYVHSNSQFIMNDGEISGNMITEGAINAINSEVEGAITFNGGTVTNNVNARNDNKDALAATCYPNAVAFSDGTGKVLVISENADVTGTIYSHANLQDEVDEKYIEISDFLGQ